MFVWSVTFVVAAMFTIGSAKNLISTIDDKGNVVTEDLDAPVPAAAAFWNVHMADLRFILYTSKDNPYILKYNDTENLKRSPWNREKKCNKFIIHGWQSSYEAENLQNLKNAILESRPDCQVTFLDWKAYNAPYVSSYAWSDDIGAYFGQFIKYMVDKANLKTSDTHVIGHSMGAHIAAYACKYMEGKLSRATALDAAWPLWEDLPPEECFHKRIALFTDAIHTSTLCGMTRTIAHADYYPHGGSNQPSCLDASVIGACDHSSAYDYYINSLYQWKNYRTYKCATAEEAQNTDLMKSTCVSSNAIMGEYADMYQTGVYHVDVGNWA